MSYWSCTYCGPMTEGMKHGAGCPNGRAQERIDLRAELTRVRAELAESREVNGAILRSRSDLISTLTAERDDLRARCEELEHLLANADTAERIVAHDAASHHAIVLDQSDRIRTLRADLDGAKAEIAGWVAWQDDHCAVERELRARIASLMNRCSDLEREYNHVCHRRDALLTQVAEWDMKHFAARADLTAARARIAELEAASGNAVYVVAKQQDRIRDLEGALRPFVAADEVVTRRGTIIEVDDEAIDAARVVLERGGK